MVGDSKLYQIELLFLILCWSNSLAVSKAKFILEDIDSWILIKVSEVNLIQVFMILVIVIQLCIFFNRIEHNFCAKPLGEPKDPRREGW